MVQVLEGLPTFGQSLVQQLANAGSQIGQGLAQRRANRLDQELISSFNPEDDPLVQIQKFAKLSEGAQKQLSPLFNHLLTSQEKQAEASAKTAKEEVPLRGVLETIKRQRELLASGHLGPKLGAGGQAPKLAHTLTKEGQKSRKEYSTLGKSYIGYASSVPIKNKAEFETLAEDLYDPALNESEIEGILDSMERIVRGHLTPEEQPRGRSIAGAYPKGSGSKNTTKVIAPNGQEAVIPNDMLEAALAAGGKLA